MQRVSILGCGWLGIPLGQALIEHGYKVTGTTREKQHHARLLEVGIQPALLDLDDVKEDHLTVFDSDVLILAFPPGRSEDVELRMQQRMETISDAVQAHGCRQIIMVSSTSVYANGGTVDETDERTPEKASGRALRKAENVLRAIPGTDVTVVRAAGLIGGDRHPGRFLAGKRDIPGADASVNLVHREDVIGMILAILDQSAWGETFNAVAPAHPTRREYYSRAAEQLGLPPPEFRNEPPGESKTVLGDKVCGSLNYTYRVPDPSVILKDGSHE